MPPKPLLSDGGRRSRAGQAMAETVIALVFILFAFLAVVQYWDNLRAKLLLEYAAFRCARARTVGYNDFKIEKMAHLATMAAAGYCLTPGETGGGLSTAQQAARMKTYLGSINASAAKCVLDFAYWDLPYMPAPEIRLAGEKVVVNIRQDRPQFFSLGDALWGRNAPKGDTAAEDLPRCALTGEGAVEAHYPAYLQ